MSNKMLQLNYTPFSNILAQDIKLIVVFWLWSFFFFLFNGSWQPELRSITATYCIDTKVCQLFKIIKNVLVKCLQSHGICVDRSGDHRKKSNLNLSKISILLEIAMLSAKLPPYTACFLTKSLVLING